MQYKLITYHYDGKPNVIDGNYIQMLNIRIGTIDDKMSELFSFNAVIPMNQEIGTLNDVAIEIERQAEQYVTINFNS